MSEREREGGRRRLFVAGATGVLGRATVPRLVAAGHHVRGVARSPEKARQLEAQGAEPVEVGLFDAAAVRAAVDGCDGVVHMATHIPRMSKAWRVKAWAENDRLRREGTPIMVQAAIDAGATLFVKESVVFSYADGGDRWLDEDAPIASTPLLASTLDAESATLGFAADDGTRRGVVLRYGLFYSHDASSIEDNLKLVRVGQAPLPGRADAYQPSIHVDDAATALVAALDAPTGIYNVADEPITKGEWADAFVDAFDIDKKVRATPKVVLKAGGEKLGVMTSSRRVTSKKFHDATGWEPEHPNAAVGLKAVGAKWQERAHG